MKKLSNENKGFSLVELIIVIAIMAILVAIIGSQVIPYMEKSRVSKDMSTLDTVYTSLQTVIADEAITTDFSTPYGTPSGDWTATADAALQTLIGFNDTDLTDKFKSKGAKGSAVQLQLSFDGSTPIIIVTAGSLSVSSLD